MAVGISVRVLMLLLSVAAIVVAMRYRSVPARQEPNRPRPFMRGDSIGPISGLSLAEADRTLIVAIRSNCRPCIASAAFYRHLVATCQSRMQSSQVRIVMITNEDAETAAKFVTATQLPFTDIIPDIAASPGFRVLSMPALILTDRSARVTDGWIGELTLEQQEDVISRLCRPQSNV